MAADPSFTTALEITRHGKDERPILLRAGDPAVVQSFVSALEKAQSDDLACERIIHALPFLVAWLQRDPVFPQAAMVPIYANLLTLFALGSALGNGAYESSQVLVSALLSTGFDLKTYQAPIADVEELGGDGFGVDMVYWVLEIIEDFMRASTPAAEARTAFLHGALSHIAPIYARLSGLQRSAVEHLARELGWTLQSFGIIVQHDGFEEVTSVPNLKFAIAPIRLGLPGFADMGRVDHGGSAAGDHRVD